MTTTAQTADYPIQCATVQGDNPFYTIQTSPLLSGALGTFATLDAMARCVRGEVGPDYSGCQDEWVKQCADNITFGQISPTKAVFDFITNWIEYVAHPIDKQVVQDCRRTIEIGSGDCVSFSVMAATLLASLGYSVRFVAQYTSDDTAYSHVYCEVLDGGQWIALDAVAKDKPLGWRQPLADGAFETSWRIF